MPDANPQTEDLFWSALAIDSPDDRARFLDAHCGSDPRRREWVEQLLAAYPKVGSFLEPPTADPAPTADVAPAERPGTVIGPYKLLQPIGEGGMGTVYMAEQTRPVRRKVALKVIKPGMDSRQVVARFEAERQALALMDHANIARVFDGGATDDGRPFFVMELVHGVPITKYCDDLRLTPRERLELFVPVCQAIQHAHQKGVIHRDIKPSNVLVTPGDGRPAPKVIDFGVAKATEQKLTDRTLVTQFGTMVGTLEYMSPEQAEMSALGVDTRSDIYSLGVLLYELLTGSTPLSHKRLQDAAYPEIVRMIREEEPPRPSTRLSDSGETLAAIAANRRTEPARLTKLLRDELDWIVLKALEKDRNRRYETANEFARDVQRYLADEPVLACPPSAGYRLRKFARRNRAALATAAVVGVALLVAAGTLGAAARDRETRQARVAGRVELIFAEVDRLAGEQKWPEALAAARRAEEAVGGGEADAATAARVRGWATDLAFIDRLEKLRLERATLVDGRFNSAGANREYTRAFREYGVDIDALGVEASVERLKARPALAVPLAAALDSWVSNRPLPSGTDPDTRKGLVAVARGLDPEPLRDKLRSLWGQPITPALLADLRRLAESIDVRAQPPATIVALGRTLARVKEWESAVRFLRAAHDAYPGDFWINLDLGVALTDRKDHRRAVWYYTAAVSVRPTSAAAHHYLGIGLTKLNLLDEAVVCYRKAIELDPRNAGAHNSLASALVAQRKPDEAVAACRTAIDLDPAEPLSYVSLSIALLVQKKAGEAVAACDKALALDPECAPAYLGIGNARMAQGNVGEAVTCYAKGIALDPTNALAHNNLGILLYLQGKFDAAAAACRTALAHDPEMVYARITLGNSLLAQNKPDEAIACYRKAIEMDPTNAAAHGNLGQVLRRRRPDEAVACFRKAAELDPTVARFHYHLGALLVGQKDFAGAVPALREATRLAPNSFAYLCDLGHALRGLGRRDEAVVAYRQAAAVSGEPAAPGTYLVQDFLNNGRVDQVLVATPDWARVSPTSTAARIDLGNALRGLGELDDAIVVFRQVLPLERKQAAAGALATPSQFALADLMSDRVWQLAAGDPGRAVALAREAVALNPNGSICRRALGAAHYRAGNWKDAVEALEKARQLSDDYRGESAGLFVLSMARARLKEADPARGLYDQAALWRMGLGVTDAELRRLCAEAARLVGREIPPTLRDGAALAPGPALLKPAAGATLDNGSEDFRKAMVWEFDWSDVPGATRYHLFVIGPNAKLSVINNATLTTSAFRYESKAYIADQWLLGRRWKVRALVQGVWTDWSEERTFDVASMYAQKSAPPKK